MIVLTRFWWGCDCEFWMWSQGAKQCDSGRCIQYKGHNKINNFYIRMFLFVCPKFMPLFLQILGNWLFQIYPYQSEDKWIIKLFGLFDQNLWNHIIKFFLRKFVIYFFQNHLNHQHFWIVSPHMINNNIHPKSHYPDESFPCIIE